VDVRFEVAERETKRVNIDYHVEFDDRYYSVPYQPRQQLLQLRATSTIVELFHRGERVASHRRNYGPKGTPVTAPEHRAKCHEDVAQRGQQGSNCAVRSRRRGKVATGRLRHRNCASED